MSEANRRNARKKPRLEELEGRLVLSTTTAASAIVPAALVKGVTYLFINGTASGTFQHPKHHIPDTGTTDLLKGTGDLGVVGKVTLSGSLTGTGFISQGHSTGTLKITNAKGSFSMQLTGPQEGPFSGPASGTYTFTIKGLSGAYKKVIGTGRVDITLASGTFSMAFHGDPNRF
jgi:hypothetical protein